MTAKPSDDAEFCEFYDETSRSLWAYLSRGSESNSAADDLLQETYVRYLQSGWRKVAQSERRFFLFRIGTNVLHDHFRRQRRNKFVTVRDNVQTMAGSATLEMDLANILRNKMTERERQLLWLAYAEEFSHREIAQMTDLREGSIRPLLFRARQKLAALLVLAGYRGKTGDRHE
jgi:RNA polymerase sigma-70 factor (ECF subfamily)